MHEESFIKNERLRGILEEHKNDITKQLKESYGRLLYSYTIQNKDALLVENKLNCYNRWEIILSAITTTGLIGAFFTTENWQNLSLIISLVLSTILLVIRFINPNDTLKKKYDMHKESANKMWLVKERYLTLLTDLPYLDISIIRQERDKLTEMLDNIYQTAPQTSNKAYSLAKEALKENEEQFFKNEELNQMLPEHLRDYLSGNL